jgi:hypothetical protein
MPSTYCSLIVSESWKRPFTSVMMSTLSCVLSRIERLLSIRARLSFSCLRAVSTLFSVAAAPMLFTWL